MTGGLAVACTHKARHWGLAFAAGTATLLLLPLVTPVAAQATTTVAPGAASAASPSAAATSRYADAVRADGPAAYWRLGEPSGNTATDSSGNGRAGTYSGTLTRGAPGALAGDPDGATGFDGATGVVNVVDDAALRLNGPFTIEFWARLDAFKGSYPGLLVKGTANTANGYLIWYTANGQLNFKRGNVSIAAPAGALTTTGWRHFAVTYDATSLRWYVDGSVVTTVSRSFATSAGTAPLQIGRGDEFGKQSLDEVAVYNRALTAAQIAAHRSAGTTSQAPSPSPSGASPSPAPTPTAAPTVLIAAAGDIACDPTDANYNNGQGTATFCRQQATAALLDKGYTAVLPLGDQQYTDATLSKLNQVYAPSWGRTKSVQRPVPGNHEYLVSGAAGYYDYYGAQAGTRGKGWYSYDLNGWHIIALNGEAEYCPHVSCSAGSEQEAWLKADLAAHKTACTLAYWHVPRYSSAERPAADNNLFASFWNDLYAAGAEVVLNGHFHNYERFAPQSPSGVADPKGIQQFVVGTGGKALVGFSTRIANSEVRNSNTYGVLEMALRPGSYSWTFRPVAGQTFTDSGSASCH
jgi:hypothetical protein